MCRRPPYSRLAPTHVSALYWCPSTHQRVSWWDCWGDDAAGTDCEGIVGRTASGQHRRWRRRVLAAEQARGVVNCPICGVALDYEHSMRPNSAEPDHVVAFKFGGGYELSNGRALCRRCNQRRGDGSRDVVNATQVKIATTDVVW